MSSPHAPPVAKVLIAAPPGGVLAGILAGLEGSPFEVVGTPRDAAETAAADRTLEHDVLIVVSGVSDDDHTLMSSLSLGRPGRPIVMVAQSTAHEAVVDAVAAGAVGFLPPSFDPLALPRVLRSVLDGQAAIPRDLVVALTAEVRRARDARRQRASARFGPLSDREWAVLVGLDAGRSTAELADDLGISPVTVRRHVGGLLTKLRVATREAAVEALRAAVSGSGRPR